MAAACYRTGDLAGSKAKLFEGHPPLARDPRKCGPVPQFPSLTAAARPATLRPSQSSTRWMHPVSDSKTHNGMAADAYIARLGERGIEYVFANAGTDFAPIV